MRSGKIPRLLVFAAVLLGTSSVLAYPTIFPTNVTIQNGGVADGYVLMGIGSTVYLLEPDGTPVHSWFPISGWTYVTRPLANGHILVKTTVSPGVYGIVELDWDSNVVWQFAQPPAGYPSGTDLHHDWYRLDNGNTLILARYTSDFPAISDKPSANDFILEVDPAGDVVWEWHTTDHFSEFGFSQERIDQIYAEGGDWAHMNSVAPIPTNVSHTDPRFMPGNLIVSYRYQGIGIIDRGTGEMVWFNSDLTVGQHEATMLPNDLPGGGNILTFDNGYAAKWGEPYNRFYSRILEIDPITETIVYDYDAESSGRNQWTFFSPMASGVQRLPNGNTFICETATGRVFEISPTGEIVWEMINPYQNPNAFNGHNVYRAYKVPLDWASSLFAPDLTVVLTDDVDPVAGGSGFSYTIQVDNPGADPAVGAQMSMSTPLGTTFESIVAPSGWNCTAPPVGSTGAIACSTSSLSAGASASFTLGVKVDACSMDGGAISHSVSVSSQGTDATPGNNATAVDTAVTSTFCDDSNLCTTDACDAGNTQCEFSPLICTPQEACRDVGTCEPTTGVCSYPVSADGSTCNDGDPTTCGDSCTTGLCGGTFVAAPPPTNDSVRVSRTDNVASLYWIDTPGEFNVYEGSIEPGVAFEYNQSCLTPGGPLSTQRIDLLDVPPSSHGDYYLVTRVDQCRDSSPGSDSSGSPRPNPNPCSGIIP